MRKRKLAVQLYTLREEGQKMGMAYILKAVADMGYMGVQPAGLYDMTPEQFVATCKDLGLEIVSSHGPACVPETIDKAIEQALALGQDHVVNGYSPKQFESLDAIKETADMVNAMIEKAEAAGLKMIQHNHWFEFEKIDGRLKYDIYAELCPKILFELDIYWATNYFKNDEIEMMEHFQDRIRLLHLKDGVGTGKIHMRPLGEGRLDIPGLLEACPDSIDNIIVELDATPINQMVALQRSYDYMTLNDLAIGYR